MQSGSIRFKPIAPPRHVIHQLRCLSLSFQTEKVWRSLKHRQRGLGPHGLSIISLKHLVFICRIRAQPA